MHPRNFIKLLVLIPLLVSTSVGGWAYTQSVRSATIQILTAQDHVEITQLYARFNQGSDFRDADLWLSTFADDAIFTLPNGQRVVGKEALTAWRTQSFAGKVGDSGRRHIHGSINLSATTDGAKGRAYWIVLNVSDKTPSLASTGYVDDVFVKTPHGWRFKTHTVHADAVGN